MQTGKEGQLHAPGAEPSEETANENRLQPTEEAKEKIIGLILAINTGHGFVLAGNYAVLLDKIESDRIKVRHAEIEGWDYTTIKNPQKSEILLGKVYKFRGTDIKIRTVEVRSYMGRAIFLVGAPKGMQILRDRVIDSGRAEQFARPNSNQAE